MSGAENPYSAPSAPLPPAPTVGRRRWNLGQHALLWSQVGLPFALAGVGPWMIARDPQGFFRFYGPMAAIIAVGGMIQAGLIRARNRRPARKRGQAAAGGLFLIQFLVYLIFLVLPILLPILVWSQLRILTGESLSRGDGQPPLAAAPGSAQAAPGFGPQAG